MEIPPERTSAGATTRFAGRAGVVINLAGGLNLGSEINLHAPAMLPENYCANIHERLILYKRVANCETPEELVDRFGLLPDPAKVLLETHRLRIAAKPLGISRIDAGPESLVLQFIPNPPIDPARIIKLVQSRKTYKLGGQDRLRVEAAMPDVAARVTQARAVLKELG